MDIEVNGNLYLIDNEDDDNYKLLSDRGWFIAIEQPSKQAEFNKLKRMSIFYRNIKHKKMIYTLNINNKISDHSFINIK